MLSGIQVTNRWFAEYNLKPEPMLTPEELALRSLTCRHELGWQPKDDSELVWLARLRVELIHPENGPKSLYTGAFEAIGEFKLFPEVPAADRNKLVGMNSGAILYGSIREWFATMTARSLHGIVELPTLDARCFLPKSESNLAASPGPMIKS